MTEISGEKKRREGRSSAQISMRERALPRLLDDIACHLGSYDFLHYPMVGSKDDEDLRRDLDRFQGALKRIKDMEHFLTSLMKYQKNLFENNQAGDETYSDKSKRTPLEQKMMQFNHVLRYGDPRQFLPKDVQFGVDLEDMIGCLTRCFDPKRRSMSDLLTRGVHAKKRFKKRPPGRMRRMDEFLDVILSKKEQPPLSVAGELLKQEDKQNLFVFSALLQASLNHQKQIERVQSINSNALARHKRACAYVDSLFDLHKKLTFVAVDLCFDDQKSLLECGKQLKAFKNNIRKSPMLPHMVGFLGKWEYTPIKGLYARMICIFKKQEKYIEDELPSTIGTYWKNDIARGDEGEDGGTFHLAVLSSGPMVFNRPVCTISRSNSQVREQLEERVIFYLTYSQEYYRYKFNKRFEQDLRKYKRKLKRERARNPEQKLRKFSGRYTALPGDYEPHDVFFKGELKAQDETLKNNEKGLVKQAAEEAQLVQSEDIEYHDGEAPMEAGSAAPIADDVQITFDMEFFERTRPDIN